MKNQRRFAPTKTGRLAPEWVAAFLRNQWPESAEYAACLSFHIFLRGTYATKNFQSRTFAAECNRNFAFFALSESTPQLQRLLLTFCLARHIRHCAKIAMRPPYSKIHD
jgi:hypothetical protein